MKHKDVSAPGVREGGGSCVYRETQGGVGRRLRGRGRGGPAVEAARVPFAAMDACEATRQETFLSFQPPAIGGEEIAAVAGTLRSGCLTTGPRAAELERRFAAYGGAEHALTVSCGTVARPVAEPACAEVLSLPLSPAHAQADIADAIEALRRVHARFTA